MTELEEQPVADQLRAWAEGMYPVEAAVELLLRAFGGRFSQPGREWIVPTEHGRYYVDFAQIPVSIGALSGGARTADDPRRSGLTTNRSTCHAASGLDRANAALVLAAISHANGSHAHPEYLPSLSAKGVQTINLSSPRIDLDSLFPRPEP